MWQCLRHDATNALTCVTGDYKVDEMIEIFRKHPKLNVAYLPERFILVLMRLLMQQNKR